MAEVEELAAPCGLYCGVCPLYKAQTDRVLAEKLVPGLGYLLKLVPAWDAELRRGM